MNVMSNDVFIAVKWLHGAYTGPCSRQKISVMHSVYLLSSWKSLMTPVTFDVLMVDKIVFFWSSLFKLVYIWLLGHKFCCHFGQFLVSFGMLEFLMNYKESTASCTKFVSSLSSYRFLLRFTEMLSVESERITIWFLLIICDNKHVS